MSYGAYPDVYFPIYMFFQNLSQDLEQLRRLFDLMPIGVMALDTDGVIIYYNRAHGKIDNLLPQEVLGRPEVSVFRYMDCKSGIMRSCQKMGRPILGFTGPYSTFKDENKIIHGTYWVFPLTNSGKKIVGSICFTVAFDSEHNQGMGKKQLMWPDLMSASQVPKKIIGENQQLLKAVAVAKNKANSPSNVLIAGETGTGKELFAKLIHESSSRADKPFLPVNCAAIPAQLLEGLLFGTTKGSFTGAVNKAGLFEEANGGTIYLDEIDSMPVELQPKLLRVLQEMRVKRLGSSRDIKLDLKIITSIGTPIHEVMVQEKLRPDLFYRLAVIVITLPPLRERLDDLDDLISYFIAKYNKLLRKKILHFDVEAKKWLKKYAWPGNVRELENLIAGTVNLADHEQVLTLAHLPDHYLYQIEQQQDHDAMFYGSIGILSERSAGRLKPPAASNQKTKKASGARPVSPAAASFENQERAAIDECLKKTGGKIGETAEMMGISRQLLNYKMKKYGLSRYDYLSQKIGPR
ncbi:sigma 54-interacting transcriptional regulator [Deltaproteobacteria bacterium OttesenSCG-928-K17]|nr:sigma 54-interacting transcriptional regulator [Deltaproteobacteria bacterium OttesenSCG-928-K17]